MLRCDKTKQKVGNCKARWNMQTSQNQVLVTPRATLAENRPSKAKQQPLLLDPAPCYAAPKAVTTAPRTEFRHSDDSE